MSDEYVIPREWIGGDDGDEWRLEVEHDLFEVGGPWLVTVHVTEYAEKTDALACLEPQAAREVASSLIVAAYHAEIQERERRKSEQEGT